MAKLSEAISLLNDWFIDEVTLENQVSQFKWNQIALIETIQRQKKDIATLQEQITNLKENIK